MKRRIFKAFVPRLAACYWIIQEHGREYPFTSWENAIGVATGGYSLRPFLSLNGLPFIRVAS